MRWGRRGQGDREEWKVCRWGGGRCRAWGSGGRWRWKILLTGKLEPSCGAFCALYPDPGLILCAVGAMGGPAAERILRCAHLPTSIVLNVHKVPCRFSKEFAQGRGREATSKPGSVRYQLQTLGRSFNCYLTQFPHLWNENNNSSCNIESLWGLKEMK